MRYGKLSENELKKMLASFSFSRGEIVKGACIGADTAVLKCADYISVTSDPITAYVEGAGELAIDINANDIYASGAEPFAACMTVLAPPDYCADDVIKEVVSAHNYAAEKGIAIVGGHTEFTDAVNRLVISVTMLGRSKRIIDNSTITAGDRVIVTKSLGLEGAKIIIDNDYKRAVQLLSIEQMTDIQNASLSVGNESLAVRDYEIHAMHDITEGGIAGAAAEIAASSNYGIRLYEEYFPITKGVKALADGYLLDVNYLISSGSMMIITPDWDRVQSALARIGVPSSLVGEVVNGESAIVRCNGMIEKIEVKTDEIYKFMNSLNN